MQMTGEQRISAPSQRVWEALHDPDILKRCIPGCQSLTAESNERMRATVDLKIGPIGARFNGTVTLSEIDPPSGYTMTIEGQGGTVGFVKSRAKVRLANDNGGTLLAYEVDAEVGGRLVQLGGPLVDATAKQLAGKFFKQFGTIVGEPVEGAVGATAAVGAQPAVGATAAVGAQAVGAQPVGGMQPPFAATGAQQMAAYASNASPSRGFPAAWILALVVAALVGYLIGHAQRGGESDWMGLAIGLLLVIVAAAGFEFGRRAAAPVITLDPSLLARLIAETKR